MFIKQNATYYQVALAARRVYHEWLATVPISIQVRLKTAEKRWIRSRINGRSMGPGAE